MTPCGIPARVVPGRRRRRGRFGALAVAYSIVSPSHGALHGRHTRVIDLKLLRSEPEGLRRSFERRGAKVDLEAIVELDRRHRRLLAKVEGLRAEQNLTNKQIADASGPARQEAISAVRELVGHLEGLEQEMLEVRSELDEVLVDVPNLVHEDAPAGSGDEANVVLRQFGDRPRLEFKARDHLEIGQALGIIDVERAAKVSGSRFAFLLRQGALLEIALVRFAFDRLSAEGFVPVIPPVLVREEAMQGTGFFPTDEAQVYRTALDDLYLAGTSEVPIASMHAGETLPPEQLPLRYAGYSTCFRREAGSYGRDTRGIIRVHQFDKVEMFSFCQPDHSEEEHAALLGFEEAIFQALEIPYRVVEICAGELAAPNFRKFDLEAWLPGAERWLEVTSCSNDIDYQARRLAIRTSAPGNGPRKGARLVHTLNGTAVAIGRALVALLENHQRPDGSVTVPEALRPYCGFDSVTPPARS